MNDGGVDLTPSRRLALLESPYPDEGLFGYLSRMAELNCATVSQVAGLVRKLYGGDSALHQLPSFPSALQDVLGLSAAQFESMAIRPGRPGDRHTAIAFGGQPIQKPVVNLRNPMICPACLREKPYRRHRWDLTLYTDCPVHGVQMIGRCPKCANRLSWMTAYVSRCGACGWDLTQSIQVPSTVAAIEMVRLLGRRAPVTPAEITDWKREGEPSLQRFFDLTVFTGGWAAARKSFIARDLVRLSLEDRRRFLETAHGILFDGDDDSKRTAFFSGLMRKVPEKQETRLSHLFPSFYVALYRQRAAAFRPLQEKFEEYIVRHSGLDITKLPNNTSMRRKLPTAIRPISINAAARALKLGRREVEHLIKVHGIHRMGGRTCHFPAQISARDLQRLRSILGSKENVDPRLPLGQHLGTGGKGYLSAKDLQRRWGISDVTIAPFFHRKIFPVARGSNVDGFRNWTINPDAYAAFEKRLAACVRHCDETAKTKPARHAIRQITQTGGTLADLFQALVDGRISLARIDDDKPGLEKLVFFSDEVKHLASIIATERRPEIMTLREAAQRLRVEARVVGRLVQMGVLAHKKNGKAKNCKILVDREAVERFHASFMPTAELWAKLGRRCVSAQLARLGLSPGVIVTYRLQKRYFYHRERVDAVLAT